MGKVVYALVRGGLGNQLFVYATARRIALQTDARLVLLSDGYEQEFHGRRLLLDRFSIDADFALLTDPEVPFERTGYVQAKRLDKIYRLFNRVQRTYLIERRKRVFSFSSARVDPRFKTVKADHSVFLDGYFQDESYFASASGSIRTELQLAKPPSVTTASLADEIRSVNAVCLQFRRTELEARDVAKRHNVTSIGYLEGLEMTFYEKAIRQLQNEHPDLRFYGFSDYPEWMEENVRLSAPVKFVTHNNTAETCHEDLYLMSLCRHHAISHSTFGWWGAWLATRPGQRVYVPSNICGRAKAPFFPDRWETIDVCQPAVAVR